MFKNYSWGSCALNSQRAPFLLLLAALVLITGCGSEEGVPQAPPSVAVPESPPESSLPTVKKPQRPSTVREPVSEKEQRMCEHEREWAYAKGLIDANQLSLFRKRNLAPVYRIPGERQSGVEAWFLCAAALRMNRFL